MGNIIYGRVLADSIIQERDGTAYTFAGNDQLVLKQMCDEINETFPDYPYKFHYLSEISMINLPVGASTILLKYIYQFESESCRSVLFPSIIVDKMEKDVKKNLDRIIMDLYHHFRESPYYIAPPESGRSAHIYLGYDNALKRVVSPKIFPELVDLMKFPRDAYILSLTLRKIVRKWAPKELGKIMAAHLMNKNVTRADVGLPEEGKYYPSLETIVDQVAFNAIDCLQFYPSEENLRIILDYTNTPYKALAEFAQKHAKLMEANLLKRKTADGSMS